MLPGSKVHEQSSRAIVFRNFRTYPTAKTREEGRKGPRRGRRRARLRSRGGAARNRDTRIPSPGAADQGVSASPPRAPRAGPGRPFQLRSEARAPREPRSRRCRCALGFGPRERSAPAPALPLPPPPPLLRLGARGRGQATASASGHLFTSAGAPGDPSFVHPQRTQLPLSSRPLGGRAGAARGPRVPSPQHARAGGWLSAGGPARAPPLSLLLWSRVTFTL